MKTVARVIQFAIIGIFVCTTSVYAQPANTKDVKSKQLETRIRNFLGAYEKKDWNLLTEQIAEGFNFTSPAGDDHIQLKLYKEKCWPNNAYFKHVDFVKIVVDGDTAFAMYDVTSTENKRVHNVEYYTFSGGKIKSIECFFGAGIGYPANSGSAK